MKNGYMDFLERKQHFGAESGFEPIFLPPFLYDFQKNLVSWSIKKGRAAIFADCGLGKTPMQLVWAENVVRKTNGHVLILTPLAVSAQTCREAEKFGINIHHARKGNINPGINITNYESLHFFNAKDFVGVVCDESSILKSFNGARRSEITEFMKKMPYRLLCTATAAPNDYIELGTSSEALGYLGYMDMLNRYFKNESNTSSIRRHYGQVVKWRLKHHAEIPFWKWVSSWARAVRKPSDMGYNDEAFKLPEMHERENLVISKTKPDGMLFSLPAIGLYEQRMERKRTIRERCEKVAEIANSSKECFLVWCHLNAEGNLLNELMPDSVQISGGDDDELKEEKFLDFSNSKTRVLITKPKIGAWGLNFQHCHRVTFFPSHSYEQYYQGVRRCWRFGQKNSVMVDIIATEGDAGVMKSLRRKADQADKMFDMLVKHMHKAEGIKKENLYNKIEEVPAWL